MSIRLPANAIATDIHRISLDQFRGLVSKPCAKRPSSRSPGIARAQKPSFSAHDERLARARHTPLPAAGVPYQEEDALQRDSHAEIMARESLCPDGAVAWAFFFHTPNGGKRPYGEAGKLFSMGVKSGVPDWQYPFACGRWSGLAIELKSATGRLSVDQARWLDAFQTRGWLTAVVTSLEEFRAVLNLFERGGKT